MPAPEDLFAAAAEDRLVRQAPLAARLRPRTLDEVVGQEHLLGPGRIDQRDLTDLYLTDDAQQVRRFVEHAVHEHEGGSDDYHSS